MKEVLHFSGPDLQRLTGLSGPDVQHLLRTVCSHLRGGRVCTGGRRRWALPTPVPAAQLPAGPGQGPGEAARRRGQRWDRRGGRGRGRRGRTRRPRAEPPWRPPPADPRSPPALDLHQQKGRFPEQHQRLSLGCPVLDGLLRGGLPLGGITELAGCSSAGKTQLALQLCLAVQLPRRLGGLEAGECRLGAGGEGGAAGRAAGLPRVDPEAPAGGGHSGAVAAQGPCTCARRTRSPTGACSSSSRSGGGQRPPTSWGTSASATTSSWSTWPTW